jgi:hypothetical protein
MHAAQPTGSQPGCIVCALPFIRPRDVQQSQAGQSAQDKQQALQTAIAPTYSVYAAALTAAKAAGQPGRKLPIIATGHLTTVGPAAMNRCVKSMWARWRPFPPMLSRQPTISPLAISTSRSSSAARSHPLQRLAHRAGL